MIARERRGTGGGGETSGIRIEDGEEKGVLLDVGTPVGRFRLSRKVVWLILAGVVALVLGNVDCVEGREANTCLAILVFATILWATEVCFRGSGSSGLIDRDLSRLSRYSSRRRQCLYS